MKNTRVLIDYISQIYNLEIAKMTYEDAYNKLSQESSKYTKRYTVKNPDSSRLGVVDFLYSNSGTFIAIVFIVIAIVVFIGVAVYAYKMDDSRGSGFFFVIIGIILGIINSIPYTLGVVLVEVVVFWILSLFWRPGAKKKRDKQEKLRYEEDLKKEELRYKNAMAMTKN